MKSVPHVNKVTAAKFFSVTVQSLDRWFAAGCPVEKRDASGDIELLDLSAMTRWRIERAYNSKDPINLRYGIDVVKSFAIEILVPCLTNDFLADIERIAGLAEVPVDTAKDVWGVWAIIAYDSLHRLFDDTEISVKQTDYTVAGLKAWGDRNRKRLKNPKKAKKAA